MSRSAFGGALLRRCARGRIVTLVLAAGLLTLYASPAAANGAPEAAAPDAIVHQVPQVPLTINGEPVPASTITRYNGQPLYLAAVPGRSPNGQLQAFTEPADFERFVRRQGGPERVLAPESAAVQNPVSLPNRPGTGRSQADKSVNVDSFLYSGDNGMFYQFHIMAGSAVSNLKQVDMVCVIWCISWNDEASSVRTTYGITLFEHIGFGGSALFITGGFHPYLASFGWDNRTSSFRA